ncbi:hypothetical protein FSPOR_1510 [Fusarium sporotrichioides]|uniref:Uncharacterized protein n=1 Tax=Fusarium sporotrichioides TaxID=5514 RepID=A0A395SN65_FUSSP|nr:hypothetical protein FSPOR_1510 [Fusarium sporotrichioides]
MVNKTHLEFTDPWSPYEDRQAGIFAWVFMGLISGCFIGLLVRDMFKKSRTGELHEEIKSFFKLLKLTINLPCMLFAEDNVMPLWYSFTNIFRSPENHRYWKKKKEEEGGGPKQFDHEAIIARLGGGWPMARCKTSSDLGSGSQDTDIEMQSLPKVTDLAPTNPGLPKIENLSAVFEVPEILSSNTNQRDDDFQPASVHGSSSGTNSLSKLKIFGFESLKDQNGKPTVDVKGKGKWRPSLEEIDAEEEMYVEKKADLDYETSTKSGSSSTNKVGESSRQRQ